MNRIVRLEEIDGDLVLRVPAEMAARLKLVAGEDVSVTDAEKSLKVESLNDDDQLALGRAIAERHREALARLAR